MDQESGRIYTTCRGTFAPMSPIFSFDYFRVISPKQGQVWRIRFSKYLRAAWYSGKLLVWATVISYWSMRQEISYSASSATPISSHSNVKIRKGAVLWNLLARKLRSGKLGQKPKENLVKRDWAHVGLDKEQKNDWWLETGGIERKRQKTVLQENMSSHFHSFSGSEFETIIHSFFGSEF